MLMCPAFVKLGNKAKEFEDKKVDDEDIEATKDENKTLLVMVDHMKALIIRINKLIFKLLLEVFSLSEFIDF